MEGRAKKDEFVKLVLSMMGHSNQGAGLEIITSLGLDWCVECAHCITA